MQGISKISLRGHGSFIAKAELILYENRILLLSLWATLLGEPCWGCRGNFCNANIKSYAFIIGARLQYRVGKIVIFCCGTGNPFFSTDSAAALRACELHADILLKATNVDGIYDRDPHQFPDAKKFTRLTYKEVLQNAIHVMDLTAFVLCMENSIPIRVFNGTESGIIVKAVSGTDVGTIIE